MRYIVESAFDISKNMKAVTIVRGRVEVEVEGRMKLALPLRVVSVAKSDGSLGAPFVDLNTEAKYNGGRSWIHPWVAQDNEFKEFKASIPAMKLFEVTDAAGEGIEIMLDSDLNEISRNVARNNIITEEQGGKLVALSKKFAKKSAETVEEKANTAVQNIRDKLKEKNAN